MISSYLHFTVEEIANFGKKNSRIVIAECGNENHEVHFKLFRQNWQWKLIRIIIACFGKNKYNFELISKYQNIATATGLTGKLSERWLSMHQTLWIAT